jgi:hypothetical protein
VIKFLTDFKERTQRYPFSTVSLFITVIVLYLPIQSWMPFARSQHYGLGLFIWGMGYVLDTIWSWRRMTNWTRFAFAGTGLYCTSLGLFCYANPWLDTRFAVQSDFQEALAKKVFTLYVCLGIPLTISWFVASAKAEKERKRLSAAQQSLTTQKNNSETTNNSAPTNDLSKSSESSIVPESDKHEK